MMAVESFCFGAPLLLLGTKMDLRNSLLDEMKQKEKDKSKPGTAEVDNAVKVDPLLLGTRHFYFQISHRPFNWRLILFF